MSNFRLVLRSGPTPGKVFPIEKNELFLGRDMGNDIVINDPEVSRRHVRIFMQGMNIVVEDLGSTNGTSINGQRLVGPYVLRPGEIITLGEHITLLFETALDPDATLASAHQPPAPVYTPPPPQPVYQAPPRQQPVYTPPPPPPQSYAGQVPVAPPPAAEPPKKGMSPVVVILLIILGIVACLCIAGGIYLYFAPAEVWCSLPFASMFFPACP